MPESRNFSKRQFLIALIAYFIFITLSFIILNPFFKKIKQANNYYREKMNTYQNLNLKNPSLNKNQPIVCPGNLFFKINSPLLSLYLFKDYLLTSSLNGKIFAINLKNPQKVINTDGLVTSFNTDSLSILATDFLNNQILKLSIKENGFAKEIFQEKIGRPSALIKTSDGNWLVTGYASGNIIKIENNQKTIFASDLDKIIGGGFDDNNLYLVRFGASPSLVLIDSKGNKKEIPEFKNFSDIIISGKNILGVYEDENKTKIGKIENDQIKEIFSIDCPSPLKIAVNKDFIFYTSLSDSEGKIYFIKNNLQIIGK